MKAAADRQRWALCGYSVHRSYVLKNKHLNPSARMQVQLTFERGKGKQFKIVSMQAEGVARRSLKKLLDSEPGDQKGRQENNSIDSSNYVFTLLGEEKYRSWTCYKLQLKPRRKSKYLIDGTAWVGKNDFMVVRLLGVLAKSPSFWIKRPAIEQQFAPVDGIWLPSYTRSTMQVLFFGEADLTIEDYGYRVQKCQHSEETTPRQ